MKHYEVRLLAGGNPDRLQQHGKLPGVPNYTDGGHQSIKECAKAVRDYIERYNLGSGNWLGGDVREVESGKWVASISYNGRIWKKRWQDA